MIKFISGCVVGIWLDGEIIAVMEEPKDANNQKRIIEEAVQNHLACDDVLITGLIELNAEMTKTEVPVHIYEDVDDRYDYVELTWITKY
ncbi:MAG TPA: hypothetical protein PKI55_06330 [Chitinophagaceae bacterium]|nr:hypothetical protein [Chitinophagaceae bacterium]